VPISPPLTPHGLPEWAEILAECERLQLSIIPSELHGGLSGWLSGGGDDSTRWLQEVMLDPQLALPDEDNPLWHLFQATASQLADPDFGFSLLLPAADAPLLDRSQALFAWCRGFVGGFGLAVGDRQTLSEEAQEVLSDLIKLAAEDGQLEGDEEDELALMELEEFVRMAALLLRGEHAPMPVRRSLH